MARRKRAEQVLDRSGISRRAAAHLCVGLAGLAVLRLHGCGGGRLFRCTAYHDTQRPRQAAHTQNRAKSIPHTNATRTFEKKQSTVCELCIPRSSCNAPDKKEETNAAREGTGLSHECADTQARTK